ncbi:MAG: HAMP domain-containing sensor histidine kinase [Actinomycetota bacterium]
MSVAIRPSADDLESSRDPAEHYVSDLSHELRQPLTVLDLRLQQFVSFHAPVDDDAGELLADIRADVQGLIEVVNDVLMLSRLDGLDADRQCDAHEIAAGVVGGLALLESSAGIRLTVTGDRSAVAAIPPTSLRRCVTALVDNAIKHSPQPSTVVVDVRRIAGEVVLQVIDEGDGVDPAVLGRLFERHVYSEGDSSSRPSFGIGLALVHQTALRHGGATSVVDSGPGGTTIELRLPAVQ